MTNAAAREMSDQTSSLVRELHLGVHSSRILMSSGVLEEYSRDQGPVTQPAMPAVVVLAESVEEVQHVMRISSRWRS